MIKCFCNQCSKEIPFTDMADHVVSFTSEYDKMDGHLCDDCKDQYDLAIAALDKSTETEKNGLRRKFNIN